MTLPSGTNPLLDELLAELATRVQAGERIDVESVLREHPEHAEQLRRLVPAVQVLADLGRSADSEGASVPPNVAPSAPVNDVLGDFRIVREVGRGGMGVVYEAEQLSLRRRVALKVLPFAGALDPRHLQRFKNEAQAAACLHHPHIVPVYFVGCERAVHFYAMQFIDGHTLADVLRGLRQEGKPGPGNAERSPTAETVPNAYLTTEGMKDSSTFFRRAAKWGVQAAEALEHAHEQGVVHRDIKPANLLIDARGTLWVTDFGLAQFQTGASLTMTGDLVGTLRYMSPEQALGRRASVGHRSDVYSLGATLYELITRQPAFGGDDRQELLRQIDRDEPRAPRQLSPAIPCDLETIVLKAMAKVPSERYGTAQELADDLRRFLTHQPIRARRAGVGVWLQKWSRRHAGIVTTVGLGLLFATVGLLVGILLIAQERAEAIRQRKDAEDARIEAVENARDLRRSLYAAQINQAHQAWKVAKVERVRELLAACVPNGPDQEDHRGFEWYYLRNLCEAEHAGQRFLRGHSGASFGVTYSPDGTRLVTTGVDRTARLWEATTGKPLHVLHGHPDDVNYAVFTPDGRTLITCGEEGSILTWDVQTGQQRAVLAWFMSLEGKHYYNGHHGAALLAATSCVMATGSASGMTFPASLVQVPPAPVAVNQVVLSPDGQTLAASLGDGSVRLLDYPSGRQRLLLPAHSPRAESVAFTSDGRTLITAGRDSTVKVWDLPGGQLRSTLQPERSWEMKSAAAAHRLPYVAAANYVGRTTLWDANTGKELFHVSGERMQAVAFSPDDRVLATSDINGITYLVEIPTGRILRLLSTDFSRIWCVAFSPDGNTLATTSDTGQVCLHDLTRGQYRARRLTPVKQVALHPDGNAVLAHGEDHIQFWDARSLSREKDTLALPLWSHRYELSEDGKTLVTHHWDGNHLRIWDLPSKRERQVIPINDGSPRPGAFQVTADGRTVLVASSNCTEFRVWDTATGKPIRTITQSDLLAGENAWISADHRFQSIFQRGSNIHLRDLAAGRLLCQFTSPPSGMLSATFDRQRKFMAVGGREYSIWLYNLESGERIAVMHGHRESIVSLAFSPDGKTLASGSWDGTVKLWHLATGQELMSLENHRRRVQYVAFCTDGSMLLSFAAEAYDLPGEALLWDAPKD